MNTVADSRPSREKTYSITELCREFHVTPRTLAFLRAEGSSLTGQTRLDQTVSLIATAPGCN